MPSVRRLRADEVEAYRALRLRALADAPDAFGEPAAEARARDAEGWTRLAHSLTAPDGNAMFVADGEGSLVGMAIGLRDPARADSVTLVGMWIDPAWRRRGLASALVSAVLDWAAAQSRPRVCLWVTETNHGAGRLYASLGFRPTDRYQPLRSNPRLQMAEMVYERAAPRTFLH